MRLKSRKEIISFSIAIYSERSVCSEFQTETLIGHFLYTTEYSIQNVFSHFPKYVTLTKSSDPISSNTRFKEIATEFDDALLQFKIRGHDLFKEAALMEISELKK